jgi:hypothetical protein
MAAFHANPFAFVFPALALCAVVIYFVYAAIDRIGLEVIDSVGTVTGKQFTRGAKSYYTTVVDGQSFVQSQGTPESYAVMFLVNGEKTSGLVSKRQFHFLNTNDSVPVRIRRTRITKRLQVVEVRQ